MVRRHRCKTCRWWDETQHLCHGGPPTLNYTGHLDCGHFPYTDANTWCGAWKKKESEEGE